MSNSPRIPTRSVYPIRVAIVYYSRFGAIEGLARHILDGAKEVAGVEGRLLPVKDWPSGDSPSNEPNGAAVRQRSALLNQLLAADAIVVGSPGYFGTMAGDLKRVLEECATSAAPPSTDRTRPWRQYLFRNKVGGAFTATGTPHGGNELTLHSILTMLMHLGMIIVTPGQQQPILENEAAPYGPTAITGATGDRPLSPEVIDNARRFGRHVAEVTAWVRLGQERWPSTVVPHPIGDGDGQSSPTEARRQG